MIKEISHQAFTEHHDRLRQIEQYQRAIKKGLNIKHFQVRNKSAIKHHRPFAAIRDFAQLQKLIAIALMNNRYSSQLVQQRYRFVY